MHPLLNPQAGEKMLLLGNLAIVRGALEAGVAFVSCYPGTPSSEVPDTFFQLAPETDIYFEYSTNEKVALEVGAGAAAAGIRTLVTMKHVGVNVAADPLMTLAYIGVEGGLVLLSADDPMLFSSQNEQDNRFYGKLSHLPILEPSSPAEAKEMTIYGFELSEEMKLPVILRTTTRINHSRGVVETGPLKTPVTRGKFTKDPFKKVAIPAVSRVLHRELLAKYDKMESMADSSRFNFLTGAGDWGIITNGVSHAYVTDALADLGLKDKVQVLRLGFSHPFPKNLVKKFLEGKKKVLVVEELEPFMETETKAAAQEAGLTLPIGGKAKDLFSRLFEYDPGLVRNITARFFDVPYTPVAKLELADMPPIPGRPPNLCPGCPHRSTFHSVKKVAGEQTIYPTDIGCYTLGVLPPLSAADFLLCMGSSISSACGISKATGQKAVGFIGDSTFFHSGITGLVDAIHNKHNVLLVILDNGTTAMTGHQTNPGVDATAVGRDKTQISIEGLVRALGVEDLQVIQPRNLKKAEDAVAAAMGREGVSVIISQEFCPLYAKKIGRLPKRPAFTIDAEKCRNHRDCLNTLACPAFYLEGESVMINPDLCIGCAVCAQVCPEHAIRPAK
ncbi:MAG: indolepyruvate ferredoxin oxidoreductase subunit alpha [Pseudomonadota bacterium]